MNEIEHIFNLESIKMSTINQDETAEAFNEFGAVQSI